MLNDFKPFKVISAKEYNNNPMDSEHIFHVVLRSPPMTDYELFEGDQSDCERTANHLNHMISTALSSYVRNLL